MNLAVDDRAVATSRWGSRDFRLLVGGQGLSWVGDAFQLPLERENPFIPPPKK